MPARQASTPGTKPIFPVAINAPVVMQVRSSLKNVAAAMSRRWVMDFRSSGGANKNLLFARQRSAWSARRIEETNGIPCNNHPTEAYGFRIFPMHAGGVRIRRRAVARMKPVQESGIDGTLRIYPPRKVDHPGAAHALCIIGRGCERHASVARGIHYEFPAVPLGHNSGSP